MLFSYELYYRGCWLLPICITVFNIFLLVGGIIDFISKNTLHKVALGDVAKFLIILFTLGFLLFIDLGRLSYGGIHLMREKEQHAVVLEGEIEQIEYLNQFKFPNIGSDYGYEESANGVEIWISGICCAAPTKGDLEVGDYVTVTYLPKSGYVLSIYEQDS